MKPISGHVSDAFNRPGVAFLDLESIDRKVR